MTEETIALVGLLIFIAAAVAMLVTI